MTHDEIIRWFRRFKFDDEFRTERNTRTVPFACICDFAGIARQNLYRILNKKIPLSESYHNRIVYAIRCVEKGMRFARIDRCYEPVGGDFKCLAPYQADAPRPSRTKAARAKAAGARHAV
jgi:hypothetical protein